MSKLRAPVISEQFPVAVRIIAIARVILAAVSLIAIYFDPTEPSSYAGLAYVLLVLYLGYSIVVYLMLHGQSAPSGRFYWFLHGIDIVWAAVIMSLTAGPNSAFFLFFTFAVVTAAYRWDLRRTMFTATATVALVAVEGILLVGVGRIDLQGEFELNRLIMRSAYILMIAFLVGYLADQEKTLRGETRAISRAVAQVQSMGGFRGAICAAFDEIFPLLGIQEAWIAVRNLENEEFGGLWTCSAKPGEKVSARWIELESAQLAAYLSESPYTAWYAMRKSPGEPFQVCVLDRQNRKLTPVSAEFAQSFPADPSILRYFCVTTRFGNEWSASLFFLNPSVGSDTAAALRFCRTIVQQLSPGMYSAYLVSRLRSRIGAVERSRIARELHDGVIQSMISLELETGAMRLRSEKDSSVAAGWLVRLQERLRQEISNLRDVMQHMRPVQVSTGNLLKTISHEIERFQRETHIQATFETQVRQPKVSSRTGRELVRIVQEGLVNVRKHSQATETTVRVSIRDENHLSLAIEDNGIGLAPGVEPRVIRERVDLIGGRLMLESGERGGAHVEVIFPGKAEA